MGGGLEEAVERGPLTAGRRRGVEGGGGWRPISARGVEGGRGGGGFGLEASGRLGVEGGGIYGQGRAREVDEG